MEEFFEQHGEVLDETVIGVCCDMWQPYTDMIDECLLNAKLIFDKYHIVHHLNQAVDEGCKEETMNKKKIQMY